MLSATNRLRQRRDFKRVYQRGRSVAVPCFALHWRKSAGKQIRIGFSVSKKLGKAVQRNAIKRRCRAAAYTLLKQMPPGYDMVFVARNAAANADFTQLKADMAKALALMQQKLVPGRKEATPPGQGARGKTREV